VKACCVNFVRVRVCCQVALARLVDWPLDPRSDPTPLRMDRLRGVPMVPRGLWRALAPTWRSNSERGHGAGQYGGDEAFCTGCALPFGCSVGGLVNGGAEFASARHFNPGLALACWRRALMAPGAPDPAMPHVTFSADVTRARVAFVWHSARFMVHVVHVAPLPCPP
jgi:hypothetical protein